MNEQIKAIIDRARALLAAATPGPWEVCPDTRPDVRTTCNTGGFLGCGHIATVSRYDANEADAALIAAAPGMLTSLCDALESAERRAEEAEARVANLENVRIEQAAKLRRHLDEIAELRERAGIAEGREAAAKANAEEMAGWLDARNAGLVQMARERDALREKLAAAEAKAARMKAPTAKVCRCVNTTYSFDPARAVVLPLAGYSITAGVGCPSCGGSGAVIVETASGE